MQTGNNQETKNDFINKVNKRENHNQSVQKGNKDLFQNAWITKFNQDAYICRPYVIAAVGNNDAVRARKGSVKDTFNIRNLIPYEE